MNIFLLIVHIISYFDKNRNDLKNLNNINCFETSSFIKIHTYTYLKKQFRCDIGEVPKCSLQQQIGKEILFFDKFLTQSGGFASSFLYETKKSIPQECTNSRHMVIRLVFVA